MYPTWLYLGELASAFTSPSQHQSPGSQMEHLALHTIKKGFRWWSRIKIGFKTFLCHQATMNDECFYIKPLKAINLHRKTHSNGLYLLMDLLLISFATLNSQTDPFSRRLNLNITDNVCFGSLMNVVERIFLFVWCLEKEREGNLIKIKNFKIIKLKKLFK